MVSKSSILLALPLICCSYFLKNSLQEKKANTTAVLECQDTTYRPLSSKSVEQKVESLLAKMTLDEKLSMLGGTDEFFLKGIDRLGIPTLKMGDGPMGVRNWGKSTLYPAAMLLAATWNEKIASSFGVALGKDSRARGMHISLAPGVNIYRSPLCGRNFEYMGEDPLLSGKMATASVKAVQSMGVAATVKHFAANNSETRRSFISNDVDERTLREIYLPAFERTVKEGNVWCIMNAYNLLNGEYCTANNWLNYTVLKGEWGFKGVVMSDWHATHSTEGAANGGLDLEMPGAEYFEPEKLKESIAAGKIKEDVINDKVRRILRLIIANGWMEKPQEDKSIPLDDPNSAATALAIAREGITLLKNDKQLLPLNVMKVKSVAVLGPNATPIVSGLGSSRVQPFHSVSFLEGIQQNVKANIHHVKWAEPAEYLEKSRFGDTKLSIYTSRKQNKQVYRQDVNGINLSWNPKAPSRNITAKDQAFSRYETVIVPAKTDEYQFVLQAKDMNVDVWINDVKKWTSVRECNGSFVLPLEAGKQYKLVVEAEQRKKDRAFYLKMGWGTKKPLIPAQQAEAVKNADIAVVCVGFNVITGEGEGYDRTYELPGRQEELILETVKLNPRTVVVLNAGGSVSTERWIHKVPGFIHTFYPGQEGGTALAEILTGKVNPSGKLPFSYEKKWEDCAAYPYYVKADDFTTKNIAYKEGIFLGYRWFDTKNIAPLFPFGYGLSYTTFAYSNLKVEKIADTVKVRVDVTNTGKREGSETVQVYVAPAKTSVERPVHELKEFSKINLKPGEKRTIRFVLDKSAFSFFHPQTKKWTVESGDFTIEAGSSSREIKRKQTIAYKL